MTEHFHSRHPLARLLIADDDTVLRTTLGKLYTKAGYDVVLADDGEEALGYMRDQAFDLALIDLNMPRMNGIETLKALKKCAPGMPVIIFTAMEDRYVYDEAISHGVDRFLTKPLRQDDLLSLVREVINNRMNQDRTSNDSEK